MAGHDMVIDTERATMAMCRYKSKPPSLQTSTQNQGSSMHKHGFQLKTIRRFEIDKRLKTLLLASENNPEEHNGPKIWNREEPWKKYEIKTTEKFEKAFRLKRSERLQDRN